MSFHKGFKTIFRFLFHGNLFSARPHFFKYVTILNLRKNPCQRNFVTFFGKYSWEMKRYPHHEKTNHFSFPKIEDIMSIVILRSRL